MDKTSFLKLVIVMWSVTPIFYFYFPDRESLGMWQNFDFGILMDSHVLRSAASKIVVFTKRLSSVRANKNDS